MYLANLNATVNSAFEYTNSGEKVTGGAKVELINLEPSFLLTYSLKLDEVDHELAPYIGISKFYMDAPTDDRLLIDVTVSDPSVKDEVE